LCTFTIPSNNQIFHTNHMLFPITANVHLRTTWSTIYIRFNMYALISFVLYNCPHSWFSKLRFMVGGARSFTTSQFSN
jgi:hypothetical protein